MSDVPIDYKYLNMDTKKFHDTQEGMVECLGPGALLRAIPNYKHNQVLIAGGRQFFTEGAAVTACRRLSGVLK